MSLNEKVVAFEVEVIEADLTDAFFARTTSSPQWCPVARAIRRRWPTARIAVRPCFARVDGLIFDTDPATRDRVHEIDSGIQVAPFTARFKLAPVRKA